MYGTNNQFFLEQGTFFLKLYKSWLVANVGSDFLRLDNIFAGAKPEDKSGPILLPFCESRRLNLEMEAGSETSWL